MNQVLAAIAERRSVRSYEAKPVPKDILEKILKAGNAAPSGANSQPWRFVVVQDASLRKKMADAALPRYQKWMAGAPQGLKEMRKAVDAVSPEPIYYGAPVVVFVIGKGMTAAFDCPMACLSMMLAARSMDIGSCWTFFGSLAVDDPEVHTALALEEGEKVYGPLVFGYPKGGFPEPPPKKEPLVSWI